MADRKNDLASRALDILRSAPFSSVVNAFVLPSDTFYELVGILEDDGADVDVDNEPDDAEPEAKSTPKKAVARKPAPKAAPAPKKPKTPSEIVSDAVGAKEAAEVLQKLRAGGGTRQAQLRSLRRQLDDQKVLQAARNVT